eukprot:jgi/Botrbrau1/16309/Bobra.0066s0077.1
MGTGLGPDFGQIANLPDQKQKIEVYRETLLRLIAARDVTSLKDFFDHMLSDDVPLVVSRQLLQTFALELSKLDAAAHKEVAEYALEKVQPRVVSYDEQVTIIREQLAQVLELEEAWAKAAQVLAGIDLDSGVKQSDNEYKLRQNIRIAMLHLEDEDHVSAETFIKKASALISSCKNEELELQYKTCYARILDSKRRFLEASLRYYELSQVGNRVVNGVEVGEEQLQMALTKAVTCGILASAGPQRSRMLATLYKDERCTQLPIFPFLEKVYLERILGPTDVAAFSEGLQEHQKAVTADGSRVWERAIVEHNVAAASRLYDNIFFPEMGQLLGVDEQKAESIAAHMIMESRLQGSIEQVEGLLEFSTHAGDLLDWDLQIESVCHRLNNMLHDRQLRVSGNQPLST